MQTLTINTDGGSRGNPGPAACAYVVSESGGVIASGAEYLGINTNNYAEYKGVILALNWISKNLPLIAKKEILFLLDSELVVKQLIGVYKVKDQNLKFLHDEIIDTLQSYSIKVSFKHVLRNFNKEADRLVNLELDSQG